jgi:hypothetical protein
VDDLGPQRAIQAGYCVHCCGETSELTICCLGGTAMLYKLDNKKKDLVRVSLSDLAVANWKEKDLENVLSKKISLVFREDQLMVISQERQWQ